MLRIIFAGCLILHGAIHLLGFTREWHLGAGTIAGEKLISFPGLTGKIAGLLWLGACLLLILSAILYLLKADSFWIVATAATIISQILIILYWQDAKFGTAANFIIAIVLVMSAAVHRFESRVRQEVMHITAAAGTLSLLVTENDTKDLPLPVQRWLRHSGILGKERPNVIRIEQKGAMRSTPTSKWMPFEATQFFTIDPPAFVWQANIHAAPMVNIAGRDKFENGRGNMLIRPLSLITLTNSSGAEIDEGTLVRFLAEMLWFPQAAVSDYLSWENVDENHANVTMKVGDVTATGIYAFDDAGNVTGFESQRYGDFDGAFRKETWSISITGHKTMDGIIIGNTSEVTWKLKDGDFTWLKLEVTNVY